MKIRLNNSKYTGKSIKCNNILLEKTTEFDRKVMDNKV